LAKIPKIRRDKRKPKVSVKRTLLLASIILVMAAMGTMYLVNTVPPPKPSNCASLTPTERSQLVTLYATYPTINASKAVRSYVCSNPDFNYGEWTNPQVESTLGGGFVEIHAMTADQSAQAANNLQPGSLFFVAIKNIGQPGAVVTATWLDTTIPDPTLQQIASGLGITI
jgi:hypothetical protein